MLQSSIFCHSSLVIQKDRINICPLKLSSKLRKNTTENKVQFGRGRLSYHSTYFTCFQKSDLLSLLDCFSFEAVAWVETGNQTVVCPDKGEYCLMEVPQELFFLFPLGSVDVELKVELDSIFLWQKRHFFSKHCTNFFPWNFYVQEVHFPTCGFKQPATVIIKSNWNTD